MNKEEMINKGFKPPFEEEFPDLDNPDRHVETSAYFETGQANATTAGYEPNKDSSNKLEADDQPQIESESQTQISKITANKNKPDIPRLTGRLATHADATQDGEEGQHLR